jgi:hypothetical protein
MSRRKDKQRRQERRQRMERRERRQRMAGDSKALEIAKEKGGKKNAAFGGKINKETPGASAFKFTGSQTQESIKGLDRDLMKKAQRGGHWGDEDRARYDKLVAANNPKPSKPENTKPVNQQVDPPKKPAPPKPEKTKPSTPVDQQVDPPKRPTRPIKPTRPQGNTQETSTVQDVTQGNHYGQVTTGNITDNKGMIDISNDNNSINITEGSNVFNYQGGQGNSVYDDTPMSAYTLNQLAQTGDGSNMTAGAKFLAGWTGLNRTLQKQNESNRSNFGQEAIEQNKMNRADPDPNNMINSMPQYMKDLSTQSMANTFGDPERWKMPKMPTFNTSTIQQNNLEALGKKGKKDKDDD